MKIQLVIAALAVFSWVGCTDSSTNNSSSSNLTGDLTGGITLTDYRDQYKSDKSGVLVQLDCTSFSAITDTAGLWIIHNLPSKTYSLTFSKEGCSTWKDESYSFLG